METPRAFKTIFPALTAIVVSFSLIGSAAAVNRAQVEPPLNSKPQIEVISPYYSVMHLTTPDGRRITGSIINGPSQPLPEYEAERKASMTTINPQGVIANFPSYDWVFGCSAVSGAMIAAWYDRGLYPNLYTGPSNAGVMPVTDTSWPTWSDGYDTYPNNPLIASHNGVDGRAGRGSIDDYWVRYNSNALDPYLAGGWTQHTWGSAIGDYMKTSQSAYGNTDGSTVFYNWNSSPDKLTCADMVNMDIDDLDGTYGRKLFYEARGYSVTDCYNQNTDNNSGGFTLANYKSEIDAGHPVLLNLDGHSIVGYGYEGSTLYIRDTWDSNPSNTYTMTWGGSYQGMSLLSVSVVKLGQGQVSTSKVYLPLITSPKTMPPPPTNPFLNPGFEAGAASWSQYSLEGWDLISPAVDTPVSAHGGSWLVWLGGDYNEVAILSQTITISASAPYLHFWYWLSSEDICGYDFFRVGVNNNDFYTLNLCETNETYGWVKKVLNLSGYVGTNKTVQFTVTTDSSLNSNLFLDDVSMSTTATMSEAEPMSVEVYPGAALMGK